MPHDSALYDTVTGHNSPAQTKAIEDAQNAATRDKYQAAARGVTAEYEGFTGQPNTIVPVLASIAPTTKAANSGAFVLTCTGSAFNEDSKVFWNSIQLATTYGSPTSLTADVPANLIPAAATAQVSVKTDGYSSVNRAFTIT